MLVVADHESKYLWDFFDRDALSDVELIVSCGDLKPEYLSFLVTMLPVPLLYVHGNHDGRYGKEPPEGCIDLEEEGVYTYKGIRFVGFGGCRSQSGLPLQYSEKDMCSHIRKTNLSICRAGGFDVLVTHAAARGLGDGEDYFHQGFECYRNMIDLWKPAYHLHGHDHLSYHYDNKRTMSCGNTQIVNGYEYCRLKLELPDTERVGFPKKIRSYIACQRSVL